MSSLIIGIAAFACMAIGYFVDSVSFLIWVGVALGIAAWVLGAKGVKANKKDGAYKTGKILGIIATVIGILLVIFAVVLTGAIIGMASTM